VNIFKKIRRYYKTVRLVNSACDTLINIPVVKDLKNLYKEFNSNTLSLLDSCALDIGCGEVPKNPFNAKDTYGIDIRANEANGIRYADLSIEAIPFEDSKFDYVTAYDFLEHIPRILYAPNRRFPFVELMNEVYRVLRPGGIFFSHTPIYPFSASFRDPTHVNIITDETFPLYFDDKLIWAKMYGFKGAFSIKLQVRKGMHLVSVMQKI